MKGLLMIFIAFTVAIVLCSCPSKVCFDANYSFNVNSSIKPDLDSIHVGDTIYLLSSFPSTLKDQNSGQEINYTEATNIGSDLRIGRLEDGNPIPVDAVADFNYVSVNGRIYNDKNIASPNGIQQLSYQEINGMYLLKIGVIAKRQGIYALGVGNGLSTGRKGGRGCEKARFNVTLDNTAQHVYYYQKWRPDYTLTESDLKILYCFKVK